VPAAIRLLCLAVRAVVAFLRVRVVRLGVRMCELVAPAVVVGMEPQRDRLLVRMVAAASEHQSRDHQREARNADERRGLVREPR
jgi:hypothetical protein